MVPTLPMNTHPSYCVLGTSDSGIGLESLQGETQFKVLLESSTIETGSLTMP